MLSIEHFQSNALNICPHNLYFLPLCLIVKLPSILKTCQSCIRTVFSHFELIDSLDRQTCRRRLISDHFGEDWNIQQCSEMCDNCLTSNKSNNAHTDVSSIVESAIRILKTAQSLGKQSSLNFNLESHYLQV